MLDNYILELESAFQAQTDADIAVQQKKYMRDQFDYFGIKTQLRREISKPFLQKEFLPTKEELPSVIRTLWTKNERDFQLFGLDLCFKYNKNLNQEDLALFEYMITHKSWWDTVDLLAVHSIGKYFMKFPLATPEKTKEWICSGNIWLQRSALLFQLKYREKTDTSLLSETIHELNGTKEFFINKAIGWTLREYAKTNPDWVIDFVRSNQLHPLSEREALKRIK